MFKNIEIKNTVKELEIESRRKMYDEAEKLGIDLMSYDDVHEIIENLKKD